MQVKSTCDVNLFSKLSIIFKEWRVIVLFVHRLFFATRIIINKINKVQWVDFKLENVLVSAPLFLSNGDLLGHSPIPPFMFI
jgi:hypothetical protein